MDRLPSRELFVTAITEAEVRTGIAILPEGTRRRGLAHAEDPTLGVLFADRVLPFDSHAARAYDCDPARILKKDRARPHPRQIRQIFATGPGVDTTTASGTLVFHVFGALAQFERDLTRERTMAGLAAARARGGGEGGRAN